MRTLLVYLFLLWRFSAFAQWDTEGLNRQYRLVALPNLVSQAEQQVDSLQTAGVPIDVQDAWDYIRFPAQLIERGAQPIADDIRAVVEFVLSKRTKRQYARNFTSSYTFQVGTRNYDLLVHKLVRRKLKQLTRRSQSVQLYGIFLGHAQADGSFKWTVLVEYVQPASGE